jgi:CRISPR-associated protein Csh2
MKRRRNREMIAKRAEILFFYDTRMSNPNGDPDANRPRIDELAKKLHVTEFRLKRTIRKHMNEVMGLPILLRQEVDEDLEEVGFKMLDRLAAPYTYEVEHIKETDKGKKKKIVIKKVNERELLKDHIDIRLFGILFAVGGVNFKQEGPVQFGIGRSLNDNVEEIRIGMTSVVPNTEKEGISKGGSFGEKYIVRYAFIQFHGFVNNNVAKQDRVDLQEEDIKTMLTAMWQGTDALATTSKFGQKSRLLLKVNYKDNGYIGDLDLMCKLHQEQNETLESILQIKLNVDNLLELIKSNKDIIESIEYEYNPVLQCTHNAKIGDFEEIITGWSKDSNIPVARLKLSEVTDK